MYGKHFASMYTGSMSGAGLHVFAVWGYVIAHTVKGEVELNPRLVAFQLGCEIADVEAALAVLCAPDPHSRNKDEDGRRLVRVGEYLYKVPSHERYRRVRDADELRSYNREAQARHRAKKKNDNNLSVSNGLSKMSSKSSHTEAETETEAEAKAETAAVAAVPAAAASVVESLTPSPTDQPDPVAAQLAALDPAAHAAYLAYRRSARVPVAVQAELQAYAGGMRPLVPTWPQLARCLREMQLAGAPFTARTVAAFLRPILRDDDQPATDAGSGDAPLEYGVF